MFILMIRMNRSTGSMYVSVDIIRKHRMKKKPNKGLQALASGSLAIARFHTELDKTERQLEHEIERENKAPTTVVGRARRKGEKLIHSKAVLIVIVILNIVDCILVLGELILDMYYIKALLESSQTVTQDFINEMKNQYPYELSNLDLTDIEPLYDHILQSHITWGNETSLDKVIGEGSVIFAANTTNVTNIRVRRATNFDSSVTKVIGNQTRSYHNSHVDDHPIEEVLAHAFHKASISILCILALENCFKIFSYGKAFLERKLEVFDCMVVFCSLFVDVYFLKGISAFKIQDFVIILAFLVPWRVIRVVNSLVVSVIEHEHFRLKLLYKQKKNVSNELKKLKSDHKILEQSFDVVKQMAVNEGIPEQKISQHLALLQQKQQKKKGRGSNDSMRRSLPLFNFKMRDTSDTSSNSILTDGVHQNGTDNNNTNQSHVTETCNNFV